MYKHKTFKDKSIAFIIGFQKHFTFILANRTQTLARRCTYYQINFRITYRFKYVCLYSIIGNIATNHCRFRIQKFVNIAPLSVNIRSNYHIHTDFFQIKF